MIEREKNQFIALIDIRHKSLIFYHNILPTINRVTVFVYAKIRKMILFNLELGFILKKDSVDEKVNCHFNLYESEMNLYM